MSTSTVRLAALYVQTRETWMDVDNWTITLRDQPARRFSSARSARNAQSGNGKAGPARPPGAVLARCGASEGPIMAPNLTPSPTSEGVRYVPLAVSAKRAGEQPGSDTAPASDQLQSCSAPCWATRLSVSIVTRQLGSLFPSAAIIG
jgi:hypothetical protein